jgi:hypothetical protein
MIADPFGRPFAGTDPDFPGATTFTDGNTWRRRGLDGGEPSAGIAPVAEEHWARIGGCADDFRSENRRAEAGAARSQPAASHLRLATPTDSLVSDLETAVRREARMLEWICTVPHTELTYSEEVLAIDRTRRPASSAIPYLASHSEHWLRVTRIQPIPDRILGELRDDDFAIYENRLVSTIVDGCLRWLTRTSQLLKDQAEAERKRIEIQAISYHLRWHRLARWLGEEAEAEDLQRLEARRREVDNLLDKLRALEHSPLREGTRGAPRVDELHITNLLADDGRYRRMVGLWTALRTQTATAEALRKDADAIWGQRFDDADTYTELLLTQACADVGLLDRITGQQTVPDLSVAVRRTPPGVSVTLTHLRGGTLSVHAAMTGVGLTNDALRDRHLRPYIGQLASSAAPSGEINCLLHPMTTTGTDSDSALIDLGVRPNALGLKPWRDASGLVILPMHPLGVDCLERLGRVLRLAAGHLRSEAFPPTTPLEGDHTLLPLATLDLDGTGLEIEDGMVLAVRADVAAPRLRAPTRAAPRHHHRQQSRPENDPWTEELEALRRQIEGMLTCATRPLEHGSTFTTVDHWTRDGYRARCTSCITAWGVRSCPTCHRRYSFTYDDHELPWDEAQKLPGGPAEYFGMDLDAEPCRIDRRATICPRCLTCSNAAHDVCDAS